MPNNKDQGFTNKDRQALNSCLNNMNKILDEMKSLKSSLKNAKQVISTQNNIINSMYKYINTTNYRIDAQEQQGRRESMRVHGVTEELGNNAEDIVNKISKEIEKLSKKDDDKDDVHINLNLDEDIQRCHFLGKKRIICKFVSYKKCMQKVH